MPFTHDTKILTEQGWATIGTTSCLNVWTGDRFERAEVVPSLTNSVIAINVDGHELTCTPDQNIALPNGRSTSAAAMSLSDRLDLPSQLPKIDMAGTHQSYVMGIYRASRNFDNRIASDHMTLTPSQFDIYQHVGGKLYIVDNTLRVDLSEVHMGYDMQSRSFMAGVLDWGGHHVLRHPKAKLVYQAHGIYAHRGELYGESLVHIPCKRSKYTVSGPLTAIELYPTGITSAPCEPDTTVYHLKGVTQFMANGIMCRT